MNDVVNIDRNAAVGPEFMSIFVPEGEDFSGMVRNQHGTFLRVLIRRGEQEERFLLPLLPDTLSQ